MVPCFVDEIFETKMQNRCLFALPWILFSLFYLKNSIFSNSWTEVEFCVRKFMERNLQIVICNQLKKPGKSNFFEMVRKSGKEILLPGSASVSYIVYSVCVSL